MLVDSLNLAGLRRHTRRKEALGKPVPKKPASLIGAAEKKKKQSGIVTSKLHSQGMTLTSKQEVISEQKRADPAKEIPTFIGVESIYIERMAKVSAKHKEIIAESLEEFLRNSYLSQSKRRNFTRIYPAPNSNYYDQFFEQSRHYNKLLYRYLYT
mmetsp:Transcript_43855/g.42367  ORF Transcript_43855/g.42367 Transcript_43855/m.42367 type:complete len:155 (-) Transcript_43855:1792-2256(-)